MKKDIFTSASEQGTPVDPQDLEQVEEATMKIKLGDLKKIIRETLEGELPQDGDTFVSVDDITKKIYLDDIVGGGDLATATWDDLGDYDTRGPQPGSPGTWFVTNSGSGWQFLPGDLVRVPEFDDAGKAWAKKSQLDKIAAAKKAASGETAIDKAMLKMLSHVTTGGVDMMDVADFKLRLRKSNIAFIFDPDDGRGIEGTINMGDLTGPLKKMGLKGVADWMMERGATKIMRSKRVFDRPYYD
jgi:hypothetical protein